MEPNHISAEPGSISELVFVAWGEALLSVPVTVWWWGEGREGEGRDSDVGAMTFVDPDINLPPGERSISRQQLGLLLPHLRERRRETTVA